MKRELEANQQTRNTISCAVCDACGGSGRIPSLAVEPFNFTALPPELQLLIVTGCGGGARENATFALACTSRGMLDLVCNPVNRTFEQTTAFRHFYHLDYMAPNKKQMVSPQRLRVLKPTCLKLFCSEWGLDCATLLALQTSLTALEMKNCDWKKAGHEIEQVLPLLTQLKHLVIEDCVFECEWPSHDSPLPSSPLTLCDPIAQLSGLQTLQLIREEPFDDACLRNLTQLRWLDVQTYETPVLASLTHLTNLEILVMDAREMAKRDCDGWARLSRLRKLYLLNSYDDNDQLEVHDLSFLPTTFTERVQIKACDIGPDPLDRHAHAIDSMDEVTEEENGDGRKDLGEYHWESSHESDSGEHSTDCGSTVESSSESSSGDEAEAYQSSSGDMSTDSGEDTPTCQCSDCIDGSDNEFK